ncbi:TAXI family TRAP transporter solute-binding subunit [Longispora sp. K20-0274]|uniref:TAXI family TRAP transporter solute-binding subunit n=1 Tax=Longispora sp. K20-0274 TaxID=3088255 RepID=UPI003999A093
MKRHLILLIALTMAVSGCGGQRHTEKKDTGAAVACKVTGETRIGIATGNTTGVYYALGNAYATQITEATGGTVKASAAETGASVQNINQLVEGKYQLAFALADTAADAVNGTGSFTAKQPIAAVARIYPNFTQVVVRADSGISSIADMRGRSISTGSPNSGTEVIANRLFTAAGLAAGDVKAQRLELGKSVEGMKDGSIDGLIFSSGLGAAGLKDLFAGGKGKYRLLDVTPLLPKLKEVNAVYDTAPIPAAAYGTDGDTPAVVVPNVLLVKNDVDAELACVLTRTLFDAKDKLAQVNASAKDITLDKARKTGPVPLHRGSEAALDKLNAPK